MVDPTVYSLLADSAARFLAVFEGFKDNKRIAEIAPALKASAAEEREFLKRMGESLLKTRQFELQPGCLVRIPDTMDVETANGAVRCFRSAIGMVETMADVPAHSTLEIGVLKAQPSFRFLLRVLGRDTMFNKVGQDAAFKKVLTIRAGDPAVQGVMYLAEVFRYSQACGVVIAIIGGALAAGGFLSSTS